MIWSVTSYVKVKQFALIIIIMSLLWKNCEQKKTHCLSIPTLPAKVDFFIRSCQSEIKSNIIDDLVFATLNDNHHIKNVNQHDLLLKHIEYLSKNQHAHYGHLPAFHPIHHHDGYEYFHEAHTHPIPHFVNPHSFTHTRHRHHPNNFNFHEFPAVGEDYAAYFDNQFKTAYPQAVEEIIQEQPTVAEIKKEKVIEAHEELMNIFANHKVIERDAGYRLQRSHFRNSSSLPRMKRSLLDMLNKNRWNTPTPVIPTAPTLPLHPVLLSGEDRWLAGCLMHCIFQKTHSLDKHGYPTLDGLVDLYTAGTSDQLYFIFTLRAVNKCLKLVAFRHHVHRSKYPHRAETCDIAFDVFDCISDSIAYYCNS